MPTLNSHLDGRGSPNAELGTATSADCELLFAGTSLTPMGDGLVVWDMDGS